MASIFANSELFVITEIQTTVDQLEPGAEVCVRELFRPDVWFSFPGRDRRRFGRIFRRLVRRGRLPLRALGRNTANHQQYRKL